MDEPSDLERSRLLLGWLQARRAVDHCLSDLLAAGPAGERRVREQLALVDDLESRAQEAFDRYRTAAETTAAAPATQWRVSTDRPRLNVVRSSEHGASTDRSVGSERDSSVQPEADLAHSAPEGRGRSDMFGRSNRNR